MKLIISPTSPVTASVRPVRQVRQVRKFAILTVLAGLLTASLTGCDLQLTADRKKELAQKIVTVLAEKGQERAVAYVEQLEAEGKITPEKAEKIKAAIPQGVEKVKNVIEQKIEAKNE